MAEGKDKQLRVFNQPFAQVFPELDDVVVEWEEWGQDVDGAAVSLGRFVMGLRERDFQGIIRCGHPKCQEGGFEIEEILDVMVQKAEETREGIFVCSGWIEDADRLPCVNSITYTIRLKYKGGTPPEQPDD